MKKKKSDHIISKFQKQKQVSLHNTGVSKKLLRISCKKNKSSSFQNNFKTKFFEMDQRIKQLKLIFSNLSREAQKCKFLQGIPEYQFKKLFKDRPKSQKNNFRKQITLVKKQNKQLNKDIKEIKLEVEGFTHCIDHQSIVYLLDTLINNLRDMLGILKKSVNGSKECISKVKPSLFKKSNRLNQKSQPFSYKVHLVSQL